MEIFSSIDLHGNEVRGATAERVGSFPANARRGRYVFHELLRGLFVCVNGTEDGADTTQRGNWQGTKVTINQFDTNGQPKGKILVTDGVGGMEYRNCDGGTIV